jgi:hypothetical protein
LRCIPGVFERLPEGAKARLDAAPGALVSLAMKLPWT